MFSGEVIKKYKTRTGRGSGKDIRDFSPPPESPEISNTWYSDLLQEDDKWDIHLSGKLTLLCDILKYAELMGEKVLLFSQSLLSLTLIEDTLAMINDARKARWVVSI